MANNLSPDQMEALRRSMMNGGRTDGTPTPQQTSPNGMPSGMMNNMNTGIPQQPNMNRVPNGMSQGMPTQQPQQQAQPMSGQQAMLARMQAQRNQAQVQPTQNVMQQGMNYQPTPQPVDQQSVNPQQGTVSNQTIINSTNRSGVRGQMQHGTGNDLVNNGAGGTDNGTTNNDSNGKSSGGKFKLNPIMAVGIVIAVLLIGFFIFSSTQKPNTGDGEDPSNPDDYVYSDPLQDPNLEWITPDSQWSYSADQIAALRAAGYTGDEIESYASSQTPYDDLIRQADAARKAYIQESIAPLLDTASPEYKAMISQTWLALRERTDCDNWNSTAMMYTERKNLDYEKIDVYGNQLFIKVYTSDSNHDDWFYVLVTPEEYKRLNDTGNIIVNYTYATQLVSESEYMSYEDTTSYYIIDASIEFVE